MGGAATCPVWRTRGALADLNPASDDYHFLRTRLVRNRNQVDFALREALETLTAAGFSDGGEE